MQLKLKYSEKVTKFKKKITHLGFDRLESFESKHNHRKE